MKMDNAGTAILECAFISKQEGVKRETTVIFTMEEKEIAAGHQIHTERKLQILNFLMITTGIGKIRMLHM